MEKLPRSAIKLLELQTVPLSQVSKELAQYVENPTKLKAEGTRLSFLKKLRGKGSSSEQSLGTTNSNAKHIYTLDVSSWLRLGLSDEKVISLCLCFTDSSGEYVAIVDEQTVSHGSSVMLSSRVTIETKGGLQALKVACAGLKDSDRCYVEDLSITRVEEHASLQKSA